MNKENNQNDIETNKTNLAASVLFENQFMSRTLDQQIARCDDYELAHYFKSWLPEHQPILEAGCGSGRWVGWFVNHGWSAAGLDWSEVLCERAREAIPGARFEAGDMRDMPFDDGEFGAIVSLGAVEHTSEGPEAALYEYYRVLRQDGIAIITVPYLSPFRRVSRFIGFPKILISRISLLRHLLRKKIGPRSYKEAKLGTLNGCAADYIVGDQGWEFFQYHFTRPQMRAFLQEAGFKVIEEFVEFRAEGVFHNFGRIAGTYDLKQGLFVFTSIGKLLKRIIPLEKVGHMLCYLVRREN